SRVAPAQSQDIVDFAISPDERKLTFLAGEGIAVFHSHHTAISFIVDVLEDVLVVYFTGRGFLPSRVISDLEVGDLIPTQINVRDQVSFITLHVIDIVKDLTGRRPNRFTDHVALV